MGIGGLFDLYLERSTSFFDAASVEPLPSFFLPPVLRSGKPPSLGAVGCDLGLSAFAYPLRDQRSRLGHSYGLAGQILITIVILVDGEIQGYRQVDPGIVVPSFWDSRSHFALEVVVEVVQELDHTLADRNSAASKLVDLEIPEADYKLHVHFFEPFDERIPA